MKIPTYKGWIWAVFIGLDQFGNALTGGHPDVTVSARVGHLSKERKRGWFMFMERLIDWAFYPVDGDYHCTAAQVTQCSEDRGRKVRRGSDVGLVLLTAGVIGLVPVLRAVNVIRRWFR